MSSDIPAVETLQWEELREIQIENFREQARRLERTCEYYRKRFADTDIDAIRKPEDLSSVKLLSKDDIRQSQQESPPLGWHACGSFEEVIQTQASSGTTGRPTYVGVSPDDQQQWNETLAEVFRTTGMSPGESCIHAFGLSKGFVGGIPVVQGLEKLGVNVIPIGAEPGAKRLLNVIDHLNPENLVATPNFARYLGKQSPKVVGKPASELSIERIACGGEPGLNAMREELAELWDARIMQIMGATEIAPAYFGECEYQNLHLVRPDLYLPEILDPNTKEPLQWEEGTTGELVMTTLAREITPMIRYQLGDIVTVDETDCKCGRTMPSLTCHGRTDEMLIVRGVNVFPSALQDVVTNSTLPLTGHFRIRKTFEGHSTENRLELLVEHKPNPELASDEIRESLSNELQSQLGVSTEIDMIPPQTITRPDADEKVSLIIEE